MSILGPILCLSGIAVIVTLVILYMRKCRVIDDEPVLGVGAIQLPTRGCPFGYDNDPLASKDHFTASQAYTELSDKILDQDLLDLDDPSYHDSDCIKHWDWDEPCDCTYSLTLEEWDELNSSDSDDYAGLSPEFTPQNPIVAEMLDDMATINARPLPMDMWPTIEKDIGGAVVGYWVGNTRVTKEAFQYAQVVMARANT